MLSFNAGFVNGVCLSGLLTESGAIASVGGFTGGYTMGALILASPTRRSEEMETAGFLFSLLFSYVVGSFLAGLITPRPKPWIIAPSYGPTFLLGSALLTAASLLAVFKVNAKHVFQLAAAANGVQIGTSSMYSANLIRSAHLTGSSTDIGLFWGQVVRGNYTNLWKLQILVGISIFFWLGSLIAFWATNRFTHFTLLFNGALYFCIGMSLIYFLVRNLHISFKEALLGTWEWGAAFEKLNLIGQDGQAVNDEVLMAIFDKIDVNGDGGLQEDELYSALQEAGFPGLNLQVVKRMMREADEDGNGEISREEWRDLVKGYFATKNIESRNLRPSNQNSMEADHSNSNHNTSMTNSGTTTTSTATNSPTEPPLAVPTDNEITTSQRVVVKAAVKSLLKDEMRVEGYSSDKSMLIR